MPRPRVALFGVRCAFTQIVAARLTDAGIPPVATILAGPSSIDQPIAVAEPGNPTTLLNSLRLGNSPERRAYLVGRLAAPETLALVRDVAPEVIVVACFPRRIPRVLYESAALGAINIHPSLLPAHRGPDPLFWIMRDGGVGCGVTVHRLADRFDTGDILAQRPVAYPDGVRQGALEELLARAGADLARSVIQGLASRSQTFIPQDEDRASYESWPARDDYAIDTERPALHAWNFVRGVAERGTTIRLYTGEGSVLVADALRYGETGEPPEPSDGEVVVRFNPGWLLATLAR